MPIKQKALSLGVEENRLGQATPHAGTQSKTYKWKENTCSKLGIRGGKPTLFLTDYGSAGACMG